MKSRKRKVEQKQMQKPVLANRASVVRFHTSAFTIYYAGRDCSTAFLGNRQNVIFAGVIIDPLLCAGSSNLRWADWRDCERVSVIETSDFLRDSIDEARFAPVLKLFPHVLRFKAEHLTDGEKGKEPV